MQEPSRRGEGRPDQEPDQGPRHADVEQDHRVAGGGRIGKSRLAAPRHDGRDPRQRQGDGARAEGGERGEDEPGGEHAQHESRAQAAFRGFEDAPPPGRSHGRFAAHLSARPAFRSGYRARSNSRAASGVRGPKPRR